MSSSELVPAPSIAVIGSGPAGCYLAHFLRKRWPAAQIVVFDRLPLPYGLVRYGVAPDHLGTKAVTRQFDRLFERDGVIFVGATEIGRDISLDEVRAAFDVTVMATGLSADRDLDVDGALPSAPTMPGVYGSGRLTRLINGHPEESAEDLMLGSRVTIVGHGNVAIDLVRLLLTAPEDLHSHGVADDVIRALTAGPVRHIDVVGRSGVAVAKFDTAMIRELGRIANVSFLADGAELAAPCAPGIDGGKRDAIADLIAKSVPTGDRRDTDRTVRFHFGWAPHRLSGTERVDGAVFRSVAGEGELDVPTDSVITAIGFTEAPGATLRRLDHETADSDLSSGRLAAGLYCVGWLRRGPQGTIPANRTDAKMVADVIGADAAAREFMPGKPGYAALVRQSA